MDNPSGQLDKGEENVGDALVAHSAGMIIPKESFFSSVSCKSFSAVFRVIITLDLHLRASLQRLPLFTEND